MAKSDLDRILSSTPVAKRQEVRDKYEARFQLAIKASNAELKQKEKERGPKKKDGYALLDKTNADKVMNKALRSIATYKAKSHNQDKQVIDFVKHLFVKYPVPYFMYQCMVKCDNPSGKIHHYARVAVLNQKGGFSYLNDIYREWFITLAQGGSFYKATKSLLTKKEAQVFLDAPSENEIHENLWWAKMKTLGIHKSVIEKLIDRIFKTYFIDDPDGRLTEALFFYANNWEKMQRNEFDEITDFVDWKLRADKEFRFKGRTVTSMIKMSNEWHIAMQKAKLGSNISWPGFGMEPWKFETKDHIHEMTELFTNKELYAEGRKQKHCVYSYVTRCAQNSCAIFSLRMYKKLLIGIDEVDNRPVYAKGEEVKRLTIESTMARNIVQVRGNLNRMSDAEEDRVLRLWSGEKGFTRTSNRW